MKVICKTNFMEAGAMLKKGDILDMNEARVMSLKGYVEPVEAAKEEKAPKNKAMEKTPKNKAMSKSKRNK